MRLRVAGYLAALTLAALIVHDVALPPGRGFAARSLLGAIAEYQAIVSPHLHGVVYCRFTPTCSHYGSGAIRKYGLFVGGAKTVWRVMRCNPLTKMGTVDLP